MKILELEQGTLEWALARLGIPTASRFDTLITPKTMKPSKSALSYRAELVAEWLIGQPLDWGTASWMDRGTDMEERARLWYEFHFDVEVREVGFILRDDGLVGCSPDGLVGDDGGLEIKCPMAHQHVKYLLGIEDLVEKHVGQVQGALLLTGRPWWDLVSYNPDLPPVVKRVERNEDYLKALTPILEPFVEQLEKDKAEWAAHKVLRPWDMEVEDE